MKFRLTLLEVPATFRRLVVHPGSAEDFILTATNQKTNRNCSQIFSNVSYVNECKKRHDLPSGHQKEEQLNGEVCIAVFRDKMCLIVVRHIYACC